MYFNGLFFSFFIQPISYCLSLMKSIFARVPQGVKET